MNKKEAQAKADKARDMQAAISWQLEHNGEMFERAKHAGDLQGKGVRATLLSSGNVGFLLTEDIPAGELEWATVVADDPYGS